MAVFQATANTITNSVTYSLLSGTSFTCTGWAKIKGVKV